MKFNMEFFLKDMHMVKIISFILVFTSLIFAGTPCQDMKRQLSSNILDQKVTTCRVSGVEPGRTDILGFFFKIAGDPSVLLYGDNYDTMLYTSDDPFLKRVKCIENNQFRSVKRFMTSEQIVDKLMSFKHCN